MALVNFSSLAALHNVRQKFEYVPPKSIMTLLTSFFLLISLKNHLKRLFLFDFNFWNLVCFQFWVSLFSNIPQTAVWCDMNRRETVSVCQRARHGKPPAGLRTDAHSQFCQPKGSTLWGTNTKTHHPIFTAFQWVLVYSVYSNAENRAKCCRT